MKKKILFIPSSMRDGGESKFVCQFINNHIDCYDFILISPDGIPDSQIELIPNSVIFIKKRLQLILLLLYLFYKTFSSKPNLIISGGRRGGFISHFLSFFTNTRLLYIPHGNHYLTSKNFLDRSYKYFDRFFLKKCTVYLMSYAEKIRYSSNNITIKNPSVIRNYIDNKSFTINNIKKADNIYKLFWIGRCDPHKNLLLALRLIKRWNKNNSKQINLDVFITNPSNEIEKKYFQKCIDEGIDNWSISKDDLNYANLKISHDALLFSSMGEGSSFVLAESILQRIPIIALKSHGVSEVVGKKRGFLYTNYKSFCIALSGLDIKKGVVNYHQKTYAEKYLTKEKVVFEQKRLIEKASNDKIF